MAQKSQEISSRSLSNWLTRAPDGSLILSHLQTLKAAADTRNPEAEALARSTLHSVSTLLGQQARQAEELQKAHATQDRVTAVWGL